MRWFNVISRTHIGSGGGSYPSAEMPFVYSTAPVDRAMCIRIIIFIFTGFHNLARLDLVKFLLVRFGQILSDSGSVIFFQECGRLI